MNSIGEDLPDKCPKDYLKWACVAAGMVFVFVGYLVFMNLVPLIGEASADAVGQPIPAVSGSAVVPTAGADVVLIEHINEEDDYEKPVCKRLEESGERYDEP